VAEQSQVPAVFLCSSVEKSTSRIALLLTTWFALYPVWKKVGNWDFWGKTDFGMIFFSCVLLLIFSFKSEVRTKYSGFLTIYIVDLFVCLRREFFF
jgi:hypothetical protein